MTLANSYDFDLAAGQSDGSIELATEVPKLPFDATDYLNFELNEDFIVPSADFVNNYTRTNSTCSVSEMLKDASPIHINEAIDNGDGIDGDLHLLDLSGSLVDNVVSEIHISNGEEVLQEQETSKIEKTLESVLSLPPEIAFELVQDDQHDDSDDESGLYSPLNESADFTITTAEHDLPTLSIHPHTIHHTSNYTHHPPSISHIDTLTHSFPSHTPASASGAVAEFPDGDDLLEAVKKYKIWDIDHPDLRCGVKTRSQKPCKNKINCTFHNGTQKRQVNRSADYENLLENFKFLQAHQGQLLSVQRSFNKKHGREKDCESRPSGELKRQNSCDIVNDLLFGNTEQFEEAYQECTRESDREMSILSDLFLDFQQVQNDFGDLLSYKLETVEEDVELRIGNFFTRLENNWEKFVHTESTC